MIAVISGAGDAGGLHCGVKDTQSCSVGVLLRAVADFDVIDGELPDDIFIPVGH